MKKEDFFYCREAAEFLGRSEGAVRNLVMRRAIPYRKVMGRLVFLRKELEEWICGSPGIRPRDIMTDCEADSTSTQ